MAETNVMEKSTRKKRKVLPRHWLLLILVRIIADWFIFPYFHFRPRYYRLKKRGPMLVLINHATEFDILFANNLFNFPLYFVASEQLLNKGFSSWLLNYVFAPIPKSKSVSDIAVVPRIKRVLDEGGNVAIFPEGNMTMHGGPSSMPPAIGKLIKMLKVPVVFVESYGLYFSSPRWSRYRKYGPSGMFIKRILEVEEYASLTGEQINELVHQQLDVNAFEQRPVRKYRGFRKAEGLQRLVFSCPSCHEPFGMHTHKSTLSCSKCGYRANYDVFGYINGPTGRLDTVTIDGIVKRDYNHYVGAHLDDIVLQDRAEFRYFIAGQKRRSPKYFQTIRLSNRGLEIDKDEGTTLYPFDEILSFTMQTRRKFIVYVKGNLSIVAKLPIAASPYQYLITMQLLHNHHQFKKGIVDYEYLAHPDDITPLGL